VEALVTARLRLEPIGAAHRAALRAMVADPRVGAMLGGVRTAAESDAILERHIAAWERDGFGLWAMLDRRTGAFTGRGGLIPQHVDGRDEVEVGWSVVPERWNQGLATEMGEAAVALAPALGLSHLISLTLPHNHASRRVMEKLGFGYERDVQHAGLPHVVYRRATGGTVP
jgi:RimJ/RimL family protein N-acetyltransferase